MTENRPPVPTLADLIAWDKADPADMLRGYLDGLYAKPWPDSEPSLAYEHGRRNGVADRTGHVDDDQRRLVAEIAPGGKLRAGT